MVDRTWDHAAHGLRGIHDGTRYSAFLTPFRNEAREKAVDMRRAKVSGEGVLEHYVEHVTERNEVNAALSRRRSMKGVRNAD